MSNQRNVNAAAVLLRTGLGVMLVSHALLKYFVFTLPGTAKFFESLGLPGFDLAVEANLAELERVTAQLRQLVYERHDLFVQPLARDRAVDQAPPLCGRRVDEAPGEQHLQRVLSAHVAGDGDTGCGAEEPVLDPGRGETAIVARDCEVARRDQLAARQRTHLTRARARPARSAPGGQGAIRTGSGSEAGSVPMTSAASFRLSAKRTLIFDARRTTCSLVRM